MKYIVIIIALFCPKSILSFDIIDALICWCSMNNPTSLKPLVDCNDSTRHVYINKLVQQRNNNNFIEFPFNGYNNSTSRYVYPLLDEYYFSYLKMPRGAFAIYLTYVILKKDTTFEPCFSKKSFKSFKPIKWYKYKGRHRMFYPVTKYNGGGKFIGQKHLDNLSGIFEKWHQKYKDSSIDVMQKHMPLEGTEYKFDWP